MLSVIMLSVVMLSVVMLSVVMLSVIMLSVVMLIAEVPLQQVADTLTVALFTNIRLGLNVRNKDYNDIIQSLVTSKTSLG